MVICLCTLCFLNNNAVDKNYNKAEATCILPYPLSQQTDLHFFMENSCHWGIHYDQTVESFEDCCITVEVAKE